MLGIPSLSIRLFTALLAMPLLAPGPALAEPVRLKGESWTIEVEPRTLAVTSRPNGAAGVVISSPQQGAEVAELRQSEREISWKLSDSGVEVLMRVEEDDALAVRFRAQKAGAFTWPVIDPQASVRAWVVPMWEGLYVPANDVHWAAFLENQGGISTTAGLSMPFWGMDCGAHSLTYILSNPFNNELEFARTNERIGLRLTHQFTPNRKVKEFGYRIVPHDASPVAPAKAYRKHLIERGEFVTLQSKIEKTPQAAKLLGAPHVYLWGDGFSVATIEAMREAGIDRAWLGSPDWKGLGDHPEGVKRAMAMGYLVGPYDSYHSIHAPTESDTWETAQFDAELYEKGAIVRADGTKRKGFKQKGHLLSPLAAKPFVEERVGRLMKQFQCNSWFVDCDAFGELFDDYSLNHPATQEDDMNARLSRMRWIGDRFGAVVGSEGGSAYAAPAIHFAHGMMTPVIGWGDPDLMKDRASKYFLGGYYPPERPAIFFKTAPMKDEHRRVYADPRFRLPLYQIVFHDSVVATHHWSFGSLKFEDPTHARQLLELLYNVPPLYHLNLAEWRAQRDEIVRHFAFFSPLHRRAGLLPMTEFEWLREDRLVQRTRFDDRFEMIANFSDAPFGHAGTQIPARSVMARRLDGASQEVFAP